MSAFGSFCTSAVHYKKYHQCLSQEQELEVNRYRQVRQSHLKNPVPPAVPACRVAVAQAALRQQAAGDGCKFN